MTTTKQKELEHFDAGRLANRVVVEHQQVGTPDTGYFASDAFPFLILTRDGKNREMAQTVSWIHVTGSMTLIALAVVDSARANQLPLKTARQIYT